MPDRLANEGHQAQQKFSVKHEIVARGVLNSSLRQHKF